MGKRIFVTEEQMNSIMRDEENWNDVTKNIMNGLDKPNYEEFLGKNLGYGSKEEMEFEEYFYKLLSDAVYTFEDMKNTLEKDDYAIANKDKYTKRLERVDSILTTLKNLLNADEEW